MTSFFTFFIMSTTLSSVGILLIMLVKKCLNKHISARWQYYIGLLFFVLLSVPFIPRGFYSFLDMGYIGRWLNTLSFGGEVAATTTGVESTGGVYGIDWMQDFAISVDRITTGYHLTFFMGIWIVGIVASIIIMLFCNRSLGLIKESVMPISSQEIISLFQRCKDEVGVKGSVFLGTSIMVKTPMTIGFFKPSIILPGAKMPLRDMGYAMLHELMHCKNKDIQINGLMCLFQILYWFNPLVYFAFKQMRMDRELACDASVLELLPKCSHISYGETLLNFVKSISTPSGMIFAANIGDSKPQIIRRVRNIASYTTESGLLRFKSICLFFLMAIFIFAKLPVISVLANNGDDRFHFQGDNVIYTDLSYFFGGLDGSFVLYDLGTGMHTIHNRDMSVTRVSPNSTYKILSGLIALETGALDARDTRREWDGTVHPFDAWNQNQCLVSAMGYSVSWYFQALDTQVGMEKLHFYLTQLSYGNQNLSGGIGDFWVESSLGISPLEQVFFLVNLYRNNTLFDAGHVDTMIDALRLSERDGAVLSGKTGTGVINGSVVNGWFVGYVLTGGDTYVFATYIVGDEDAGGSIAARITLSILESMGIY